MFVDPASRHLESFSDLFDGQKLFTHEHTPSVIGLRPRCDGRGLHSWRADLERVRSLVEEAAEGIRWLLDTKGGAWRRF